MANIKTLQRSFAGGEVSPEMYGRSDDTKYMSGAATMRNFICKPQGPAENRPGFAFVGATKYTDKKARLIPFTYSTTQTMVLEMGEEYFRFHSQGLTLLVGTPDAWATTTAYAVGALVTESTKKYYCTTAHTSGTFATDLAAGKWYEVTSSAYEIPSPYAEADLFDIHYVQSADVLTLVHPNYPPKELRRYGIRDWRLVDIDFTPTATAPTGVTATPTCTTAKYTNAYVVTSIGADSISESVASSEATCSGNLYETGGYNTISWTAVSGATRYYVYRKSCGIYGYIGATTSTSVVDDNISPDMSQTPPTYESVFGSTDNYPSAVSYFEQRRAFAGTTNQPQNIWLTKSGTENNMSYSLPVRDNDRIAFRVAAREANTIRHIVPLAQMLLLTSSAEWRVTSINSDAITPSTFSVRPQSYVGASNVQPVIINNNLLYVAARGGHIRECSYNWQANGFVTGDISLRSPHLFDSYDITDMTYSKAPLPLVWMVSTTGNLLGLTYVPEQQIGAWHQHDTDGLFESCAVVAEGNEDRLYVIVKRTINGSTVRYVERMASRQFVNQEDAFFVDSGITYDSTATTTITGLDHLNGKTVNILADGAVHPQRVVSGGNITLDVAASVVQVGLPITADIKTLPLAMQIDNAFGQGRMKNINKAWLRVYRSSDIWCGPSLDKLVEYKQRRSEAYGVAPALASEEVEIMVSPAWANGGQIYIRQSDPLPLTIASLTMEVALGG